MKKMLKSLPVQAHDSYALHTSIVQKEEQITNGDAKAAGDIKKFATRKKDVLKSCLNRIKYSNAQMLWQKIQKH